MTSGEQFSMAKGWLVGGEGSCCTWLPGRGESSTAGCSVPAQAQRGQDDYHEHQEEETLVHSELIFT